MPVLSCSRDGEKAWKWGPSGVCFKGESGRKRALAVGRAINAQRSKSDNEDDWSAQAELEAAILDVTDKGLGAVLAQLPFMQEELSIQWVKKADEELQIVWGEVYIPDLPDVDEEFMTVPEVRKMAHKFLLQGRTKGCIDRQHDNEVRDHCFVVESFIARNGDPLFIENAWVIGMLLDDEHWEAFKSGELNGFSMQALVKTEERLVTLDIPEEVSGLTQVASDGDSHRHTYTVNFDDNGGFAGGTTDLVNSHKHLLGRRSVSGPAVDAAGHPLADQHVHRYTFQDQLAGQIEEEAPGGIEA